MKRTSLAPTISKERSVAEAAVDDAARAAWYQSYEHEIAPFYKAVGGTREPVDYQALED